MVDQDSELEAAALRGELPWIDHQVDARNRSDLGIERDYVLTPVLMELFDRCFRLGIQEPEIRPVMAEWAEALEAASATQVLCHDAVGCGSTFYWNKTLQCPFCDTQHEPATALRLKHAAYIPASDLDENALPAHSWVDTGIVAVLSANELVLKAAPPGTSSYAESEIVAKLQLDGNDLLIRAGKSKVLHLQVAGSKVGSPLKGVSRVAKDGRIKALHVGALDVLHDVWRFKW